MRQTSHFQGFRMSPVLVRQAHRFLLALSAGEVLPADQIQAAPLDWLLRGQLVELVGNAAGLSEGAAAARPPALVRITAAGREAVLGKQRSPAAVFH